MKGTMRRFILAALGALCLVAPSVARATPFADVPTDHWAEQAISSLAADGLIDGYPSGDFKGDRPLTRYEMALLVARVLAKLQTGGPGAVPALPFDPTLYATRLQVDALGRSVAQTPSKADLDTLQKLVLALKDELDGLGVRVASVEDALADVNQRTKFAQSLALHGTLINNVQGRQWNALPQSVLNTTGTSVTTAYGATIAPGARGPLDPLFDVFAASGDENNPTGSFGSGTTIRSDDRLNLTYTVDKNLSIQMPIRYRNDGTLGAASSDVGLEPEVFVRVDRFGALTNVVLHAGMLNDLPSSRLGLAYRAPDDSQDNVYGIPFQAIAQGVGAKARIGGYTDVAVSFGQLHPLLIDTSPNVLDPALGVLPSAYFQPVLAPRVSTVQTGTSPTTDTFVAGQNGLTSVYLREQAVAGSVVVSGVTLASGYTGAIPAFSFITAANLVVFATPIPPGATVRITYTGLGTTEDAQLQRYQATLRINHVIAGFPGAEVGLSLQHIYDDRLLVATGSSNAVSNTPFGDPLGNGFGAISDTVFGLDGQIPLAFLANHAQRGVPIAFAEVAFTSETPNAGVIAPTGAVGAVGGVRATFGALAATLQVQAVGANYVAGTPLQFFGNAPATWQNDATVALPGFFGFSNRLGLNRTFDATVNAVHPGTSNTAGNPNLSVLAPIWNPFAVSGPGWYSQYAPNERGASLALSAPWSLGGTRVDSRVYLAHLEQLAADANATATFGPSLPSGVPASLTTLSANAKFTLPVGRIPVGVGVNASVERLVRRDETSMSYVPYDPLTNEPDTGAVSALAAAGVAGPSYAPNDLDVRRTRLGMNLSFPIAQNLTAGIGLNRQRYAGNAGTSGSPNVAETKDQADVSLTYAIPKTANTLGFDLRSNAYQDGLIPNADFRQTSEDLTLTIRF